MGGQASMFDEGESQALDAGVVQAELSLEAAIGHPAEASQQLGRAAHEVGRGRRRARGARRHEIRRG
jgi:hypothetical protein